MPFINSLKRRLDNGESKDTVLNRELAFNELDTLKAMVPGLKQTIQKCVDVDIVVVEDVKGDLPQAAGAAEPGSPSFAFENVEGLAHR